MILSHILFQLPTEADILTFLSLGGACLIDPANNTEPTDELIEFLKQKGLDIKNFCTPERSSTDEPIKPQ